MPQLANRRHEVFAVELAAGAPLLSAYLTAGYKESYSARFNASRLRNTPVVRQRVDELLAEFGERSAIKLAYVQAKVLDLLELDPIELYEKSIDSLGAGKLKLRSLSEMPSRVRRAISRIKVDGAGKPTEIVLSDKVAAANALFRTIPGGSRLEIDDARTDDASDDEVYAKLFETTLLLFRKIGVSEPLLDALEAELMTMVENGIQIGPPKEHIEQAPDVLSRGTVTPRADMSQRHDGVVTP
jgi:hypothetical protein